MMVERLVVAILLIFALWAFYTAFTWWHRRTINGRIATLQTPELLYFGSENCASCPTQVRYINQIAKQWAQHVKIRQVDVDAEPETAVKYRVMSLPTTMLLTKEGNIHSINYGLTSSHKLNAQIEQLGLS